MLKNMITTDRSIIKLHLYHPTSSLVINNPSGKFAVVFEVILLVMWSQISISGNLNYQSSSVNSVLEFESFEVSPIRGIILPQDSQLIKVTAHVSRSSQYKN